MHNPHSAVILSFLLSAALNSIRRGGRGGAEPVAMVRCDRLRRERYRPGGSLGIACQPSASEIQSRTSFCGAWKGTEMGLPALTGVSGHQKGIECDLLD